MFATVMGVFQCHNYSECVCVCERERERESYLFVTVVGVFQSHNHSLCIRPALPKYNVVPQDMTLQLGGSFVRPP